MIAVARAPPIEAPRPGRFPQSFPAQSMDYVRERIVESGRWGAAAVGEHQSGRLPTLAKRSGLPTTNDTESSIDTRRDLRDRVRRSGATPHPRGPQREE